MTSKFPILFQALGGNHVFLFFISFHLSYLFFTPLSTPKFCLILDLA